MSFFFKKHNTNNKNDMVDPKALILASIFIKFAKSKRDSGLFSVDNNSLFITCRGFRDDYEKEDWFWSTTYKWTEEEVSLFKLLARPVGRDSIDITYNIVGSRKTKEAVVQLVEDNKNCFKNISNENGKYCAYA